MTAAFDESSVRKMVTKNPQAGISLLKRREPPAHGFQTSVFLRKGHI